MNHKLQNCADTDFPNSTRVSPFAQSFPETYSIDQRLSTYTLIIVSFRQWYSSAECRTNVCQVYMQKSPQSWCRLTLVLRFHKSSIHWAATRVSQEQVQIKRTTISSMSLQMPYSLQQSIRAVLSPTQRHAPDINVRCSALDKDPMQAQKDCCNRYHERELGRLKSECGSPMTFSGQPWLRPVLGRQSGTDSDT